MSSTVATRCLVCDALIEVVDAYETKQIECPECGELFRVVSLGPLQLAYAYDLNEEGEFYDEDKPHR
jgi:DNA-directed RNA polymerase subunit RPC12/RpoP